MASRSESSVKLQGLVRAVKSHAARTRARRTSPRSQALKSWKSRLTLVVEKVRGLNQKGDSSREQATSHVPHDTPA